MGERILLIEDNTDLLTTLAMVLEFERFEVLQAVNGRDAQALLSDRPQALPDLIALDLQMPVMDGATFVRTLPALGLPGSACIPLLVITASTQSPPWATAIVRKPFEIDRFLDAVRALLASGRQAPGCQA